MCWHTSTNMLTHFHECVDTLPRMCWHTSTNVLTHFHECIDTLPRMCWQTATYTTYWHTSTTTMFDTLPPTPCVDTHVCQQWSKTCRCASLAQCYLYLTKTSWSQAYRKYLQPHWLTLYVEKTSPLTFEHSSRSWLLNCVNACGRAEWATVLFTPDLTNHDILMYAAKPAHLFIFALAYRQWHLGAFLPLRRIISNRGAC